MICRIIITLTAVFLIITNTSAENDKYRLILTDDPSTTITIAWNQISGNSPVVYYDVVDHGTNHIQYSFSKTVDRVQSAKGMSNQFARLTGLIANTSYYFVINDSEGNSERFWFKTAPDDNSRLSFIAGGDSRNNRVPRQNANLLVSKLKPHAVFFGGDMTDDDTSGEWQNWFDDWQLTTASDGRMIPIVPARGNHEDATSIYDLFDTSIADAYGAFTWGNNLIRTYTLNSEISVVGNQLTWLENDLTSSSGMTWKMAQYHKPMRPHTSGKSEGNSEYAAWAQLFYDNQVKLVVDCDSHMSKTTYPIKPSSEPGNDEGFVIDHAKGTVYTGEGCWGAPLRPNDDDKSWTRNSGSFNQFKLIFVDEERIELRTINTNNADDVSEGSNEDPFILPTNLDVFNPPTGDVVIITNELSVTATITNGNDDVEENETNGSVYSTSSDIELGFDSHLSQNYQTVGLRYNNLEIPSGATITSAYLEFTVEGTNSGTCNVEINGEKAGNSSPFTTTAYDVSNRTKTTASVNWSPDDWTAIGVRKNSPDLSQIVQEIIDQHDWQANNSMSMIIKGSIGTRQAESYEGNAGSAPKLIITYEVNPNQTVIAAIASGNDDVEENEINGNIYSTSSDIELGFDSHLSQNYQTVGLRYNDLDIPNAAIITSAYLEFTVEGINSDTCTVEINGEKAGNSAPFTTTPYDVSNRTKTNSSVNWSPDDWTAIGVRKNSPDLSRIVQEIVDQPGWRANNSMSMIIKGSIGTRQAESYEGNAALAPRLIITYEVNPTETVTAAIASGNDDVEENETNGNIYSTSSDIELGFDSHASQNYQTVGLRYNNLDIPSGAIITGAYLEFTVEGTNSGTCNVNINGEKTGNSSPFTTTPYDVSSRTKTNATVSWSPDDWTAIGVRKYSPDLSEIVQEIIDQPDWQVNNSMSMIIKGSIGTRQAESYEGNAALAPKLTITYEVSPSRIVAAAIASGNDDVEENETNGSIYSTSSDIELGFDSHLNQNYQTVGLRYNNLYIPSGATITGAYLEFTVEGFNSDTCTVEINGEKTGNSSPFTTTPYDVSSRTKTNSSVNWSPDDWTNIGVRKNSPDLSQIVQEIIDHPDWQANNSMSMIIKGSIGTRQAESYEGNAVLAPKLIITYEVSLSRIVTATITSGNDDVEENETNGNIYSTSSDIELGFDGHLNQNYQTVGLRYNNLYILNGATITSAYLEFTVEGTNLGTCTVEINGEKAGNSSPFTTTPYDVSTRTKTNSSVNWSPDDWTTIGVKKNSPDLSQIVQEIIDHPDWQAYNSLSVIIKGSIGTRQAESYEGNAGLAAKLFVTYRQPGSSNLAKISSNVSNGSLATPDIDETLLQEVQPLKLEDGNHVKVDVQIFPNPTSGLLNIKGLENGQIKIFNTAGILVQAIDYRGQAIDMSNSRNGLYFIVIAKEKEKVFSGRLIKL